MPGVKGGQHKQTLLEAVTVCTVCTVVAGKVLHMVLHVCGCSQHALDGAHSVAAVDQAVQAVQMLVASAHHANAAG
jgi:hypothetical protein